MSEEGLAYSEILAHAGERAERLLEHPDPAVRDDAAEVLDWIDAYHREGLGRLVEMVRQWRGEIFLEQAALDPVVGELLATYSLGVDVDATAIERTVQAALDEVRPYVASHGGDLEVLSVEDGVVGLRMHGNCDGCTAAGDTIANRIEAALREHWIDFRRVEVTEATQPPHPPPAPGQVTTGLDIGPRR